MRSLHKHALAGEHVRDRGRVMARHQKQRKHGTDEHQTPASYLKQWADKRTKSLWVYDIAKDLHETKTPKQILKAPDYYTVDGHGSDPDPQWDKLIQTIESHAGPVRIRINKWAHTTNYRLSDLGKHTPTLQQWLPPQLPALYRFAALQYCRVPAIHESWRQIHEQTPLAHFMDFHPGWATCGIYQRVLQRFIQMRVQIAVTETDLVTSDRPCYDIRYDPETKALRPPTAGFGVMSEDPLVQVFLPLGRRVAMRLFDVAHPLMRVGFTPIDFDFHEKRIVDDLNAFTAGIAHNFIISATRFERAREYVEEFRSYGWRESNPDPATLIVGGASL